MMSDMENEEAVSAVIALMLILGIIVTLIAIYSATYLPELKQQSEIEHSREVADAFVRFGSDLDYVLSHKTTARFSEPFSLGGGDVLLSPVRSSGSLAIEQQALASVSVRNRTQNMKAEASLVNISYVPSFTTWEPQGYRWEYGSVVVTKDDREVPQSSRYDKMDEMLKDRGNFLGSFVDLTDSGSGIVITMVNLIPVEGKSFLTGSGIATLGLDAKAGSENDVSFTEVSEIVFKGPTSGPDKAIIREHLNKLCTRVSGATYLPDKNTLTFDPDVNPVSVTLRKVNIEVSVC